MTVFLHAEEVSKIYNAGRPDEVTAVNRASLKIEQGDFAVLKGPSGSGKTSLLSLLGCMARPTEGSICLRGRDVAKLPEQFLGEIRRQTYGFIFQQFNLIRNVSVLQNVLLPLYPQKIGFSAMQERAAEILQQLDIADKVSTKVNRLSGGEQQRVAIARALINKPEVVIADEPTAHLDSQLSLELMNILARLNDAGKTILIATHDPFVFQHQRVRKVYEMRDGQIVEEC